MLFHVLIFFCFGLALFWHFFHFARSHDTWVSYLFIFLDLSTQKKYVFNQYPSISPSTTLISHGTDIIAQILKFRKIPVIFLSSVKLIFSLDLFLFEIIILSLKVSFTALVISSFFALILGYLLALNEFYLKTLLIIFFNSLNKRLYKKIFLLIIFIWV